MPAFLEAEQALIAHDGARLGLTVWPAEGAAEPRHVIVGVHGMNNYAGEFRLAAPEWARDGVAVYAYDQRGFGRSEERGLWAGEALMQEDLRTAATLARARHPDATLTVVAISMGAALAITAFASGNPPDADRLILSGPGLRGWGALNPLFASTLWIGSKAAPGMVVRPPKFAKPKLTDNDAFLALQDADPHHARENRIDQLKGAVALMEHAHAQVRRLPARVPVLVSYGAHDQVVPPNGPKRTAPHLPAHVRTVYYKDGYHVLLSDLQRARVIADYLAFMRDPAGALPSGEPEWPFR
ncbi:MAG: alpha/beta fold hydrolase [Hyphomonas sp.]